ncbi:PREDICTED: uncharacterized protein LOC107189855 [Dufourea novaeangliae]|uniref:uncharacterized protein LOC107189855 n=1 Tax=Dufourea novaeangliae TaxID=178035 RepID=UPI000767269D|nr:PREDICTED: uncharacterized protein LOC107189855 [Dufourea novaeangliae]
MSTTDVFRFEQPGPAAEEEQGRLRADLQYLRRRGLLKASGELSCQGRKCTKCSTPFGRFYNTGAPCARCRHRVCRQCCIEVRRLVDNKDVEWICNVCYKIAELSAATGDWIYETPVCKGSINRKNSASTVEILKHTIRRAWTINGLPTRWSTTRTSPELRLYRSLPTRRQEYREIIDKNEFVKPADDQSLDLDQRAPVTWEAIKQVWGCGDSTKNDPCKHVVTGNETISPEIFTARFDINDRRTSKRGEKLSNKQEEEVPSYDAIKPKKLDRFTATIGFKTKTEVQVETSNNQEQNSLRISLIKSPKILSKLISPEIKLAQSKHGERKSSIPIFRRSSKEFEDIRSPQESPKRSLIPQRYRGSTDDLRRSREDISVPSLIPKLLSGRSKEEKLKRQDSKDDIRSNVKFVRKDLKEETKSSVFQPGSKEDSKHGIRLFRRDSSHADVGRDSVNLNAHATGVTAKGKQAGREEKQERADERVGVSAVVRSRSTVHEQRTKVLSREGRETADCKSSRNDEECLQQNDGMKAKTGSKEETMLDVVAAEEKLLQDREGIKRDDKGKLMEVENAKQMVEQQLAEDDRSSDSMKDSVTDETDATHFGASERKIAGDLGQGKKFDDFQVVRRKFSKEEFSNPDEADDIPNKRCSSQLSPEASPLSTRSSRYSPRESESEPTPALSRKAGDSWSASQRIRDAITRTRRESNSSTRYESSGSESVRFSETGFHGYAELARKVKLFTGSGSGAATSTIRNDETVQRDSATSAGEDEPHDDNHGRTGPVSFQGRSILRRRRQFDAQGSRRRGRSHARNCYTEELQNFQALHVIGRGGRQQSPTGIQGQDQLAVDYRRLVFISSDSSSGREEDDADSSCSSSSFLNGIPRSGSRTQSLEDCDWDYFESGSLPLPTGVPITIGTNNNGQDWNCCPGRGSTACQACGGSRGTNVLPVPVPIPVPVPYPVPVPAALWTGDFAVAASSMISRGNDADLHGTRIDTRFTAAFDPTTCTFRPDQVVTPLLYGSSIQSSTSSATETLQQQLCNLQINQDEKDDVSVAAKSEAFKLEAIFDTNETKATDSTKVRGISSPSSADKSQENDEPSKTSKNEEISGQDSGSVSFESRRGQRMFQRDDSGSSSGRSSADSSDLDEDSSSHRFSRVFVVNDDSLTSDNDIEDNGDEDDDSDSDGITLKRVTSLPEEEPVVLQYVRFLNDDSNFEHSNRNTNKDSSEEETNTKKVVTEDENTQMLGRNARKCGIKTNSDKVSSLLEEMYIASDNDSSENQIELKSVKTLDPDNIESLNPVETMAAEDGTDSEGKTFEIDENTDNEPTLLLPEVWDPNIIPDSLEIGQEISQFPNSSPVTPNIEIMADEPVEQSNDNAGVLTDSNFNFNMTANTSMCSGSESFTSNDTNATGSEVSSDELHEYEVSPISVSYDETLFSAMNSELLSKLGEMKDAGTSRWNYDTRKCFKDEESGVTTSKRINRYGRSSAEQQPLDDSCAKGVGIMRIENDLTSIAEEEDQPAISHSERSMTPEIKDGGKDNDLPEARCGVELSSAGRDVGDTITDTTHEIFTSAGNTAHDQCQVRGENPVGHVAVGAGNGGCGEGGGSSEEGVLTRFRSVERQPSSRKENGLRAAASTKDSISNDQHFLSTVRNNNNIGSNNTNKHRSLVMITQETSYQPVSVVTSDTTTLLQPDEVHTASQGLAGYFQLALEAVAEQPHRKNGQGHRKPLMVKRLTSTTNHYEPEVDSGLSVSSASESDDVSVKNSAKLVGRLGNNEKSVAKETPSNDQRENTRTRVSSQSSDDNSGSGGVVILEEGLADDDSWVEEVSHDEDEPGAITATEESSEDEANNLGDREEELRGYHRQAIDFTLHTIVEESCEESEAEPNLATGSPSKKQRPPSASELEKYFFFGLGGDGNNSSMGSREVDSLSETSSIYSEGLESLGQDEGTAQGQERSSSGEGFLNSSRLEKYFLSEFLGFDQDRRDSDGSVGSDSEGRPSPEAQRRKKLVRARGTGRSHSSSLDNLLALAQSSQNLSSQNSLQDLSLNQDLQESQSEGSSTETDGADDGQTAAFGADGQFDTVKRKKKKPRNLGTQSPRVQDDRNKTPEPSREMVLVGEVVLEDEAEVNNSEDSERAKTPQPECVLSSSSLSLAAANSLATSTPQSDSVMSIQIISGDSTYNERSKQQSRDSGFIGSCDDLLQHQKISDDVQANAEVNQEIGKDSSKENGENIQDAGKTSREKNFVIDKSSVPKVDHLLGHTTLPHLSNASLSRKDSFNNWSSDEETNLMMSKMRQFFKTMVANSNGQNQNTASGPSSGASPAPSPRLPGYPSKVKLCSQNRTKPPQLVYFENELTRLMKTVPGIRDDQVREIVEYLSSEDTWSDSYDSSDYTSSDLEGAAGGRRSALQEQISQSCQQIISKFDTTTNQNLVDKEKEDKATTTGVQPKSLGKDTAFVYQKLVQSFTKMAGDGISSDANSTPHSSPPLIAKVMHHIGSRLVALMHEVSEGGPAVQHHSTSWRRYSQHHRTPSSASTTEDDDSTSDSTNATSSTHLQLPRSKSHDPLLLINNHPAASTGQEGEEREASDYERFSWRGSFESALMAADSRTKLSLLACSGDVSVGANTSANALAMVAKRRSAGDLLFNPKSFSREQLDRVRSCGSIGGGTGGAASGCGGAVEERIWSNRRRSSVPDANTKGESGDEDTEDELEYNGESRATTLPRGIQSAITAATNSLPRLSASTTPAGLTTTSATPVSTMHKAHSVYHFLPQHSAVKSARYRPPGFARNSNVAGAIGGPKRAVSAPGLQISGSQSSTGKRDNSRSRRQHAMSLTSDDGSSLSEACSTPIIGAGSRTGSDHAIMDVDDMDQGLHAGNLPTRASLSSLGARSDSMASVYSGAGEGRCCRSVVVTGEVEFALQYDYKHLTFEVHVTKCKNLAPVDVKRKRSDPYVKVYLLPDKSKSGKRKTKVKKHTLNPEFNETLKFHMNLSGLETRTLWLTVWHSDMFGRNDFLGEVRMPLENKIFDDPTPKWYLLQERTEPFDDPVAYKGEVIIGLKFVPPDPTQQDRDREIGCDRTASKSKKNWSRGALHVLVKEARNLQTRGKNSGTCDPFCKSYLLPDKGRSGKQKTGVVRRSGGSPVWSHTFIYKDVSIQELAERGLELTVWDHDRIASNEFLGGVRFNLGTGKHYGKPVDWMDATGRELSLWQSMLERPNFWVEGAVTLRPNLHNHGKTSNS